MPSAALTPDVAMPAAAGAAWAALASVFSWFAATGPEATLAHAAWCLAGTGPALHGTLVMAHCPWCYAAAAAALAASAYAAQAVRASVRS